MPIPQDAIRLDDVPSVGVKDYLNDYVWTISGRRNVVIPRWAAKQLAKEMGTTITYKRLSSTDETAYVEFFSWDGSIRVFTEPATESVAAE